MEGYMEGMEILLVENEEKINFKKYLFRENQNILQQFLDIKDYKIIMNLVNKVRKL